MHRILVASLLLGPLLFPPASVASDTTTGGCAVTPDIKVSTGVTAPRIIQAVEISPLTRMQLQSLASDAEVDVALQVDEKGNAKNVQIVNSTDRLLNAGVMAAVQRYRFHPAMLDNHAVAMDLTLKVDLHP